MMALYCLKRWLQSSWSWPLFRWRKGEQTHGPVNNATLNPEIDWINKNYCFYISGRKWNGKTPNPWPCININDSVSGFTVAIILKSHTVQCATMKIIPYTDTWQLELNIFFLDFYFMFTDSHDIHIFWT